MPSEQCWKWLNCKLTRPSSVACVVVGTYCAGGNCFLTIYYLLNLGIPAGSPRYFGGQRSLWVAVFHSL